MQNENIFKIMRDLKDLPFSERQVVEFILSEPEKVCNMTIVELGANTFTSASTVTRVCQRINTKGYIDLKQRICTDLEGYQEYLFVNQDKRPLTSSSDSIEGTIENVIENSVDGLKDVKLLNSPEKFQTVIDLIKKAPKITLYGDGVSNLIAQDAAIKGLRLGLNVYSFNSYSEMSMHARMSGTDDVGIIVSYTGFTSNMVKIAKILNYNKSNVISLTSNTVNEISKVADLNLHVRNRESYYRIGGIESRTSMQSVLDIIFSGYYDQTKKAKEASVVTFTLDNFTQD